MQTERLQRSVRVTLAGLVVNALLALGKFVAGAVGHSNALIADAVESMADTISSIIVWRGMVVAATPADAEHPYGHGKAEPMAAAFVATLLMFAAVGIAYQSIREILSPTHIPAMFTLWVLILVVVVKEGLFRFASREARQVESTAIDSDAWHHRSDAITSVAAGLGISIAVVGGPAFAAADDYAAVIAAGIIGWNGWRLLRPAVDELMDRAPDTSVEDEIRSLAQGTPGVDLIETCRVRKMGYYYFVDMHVEVDPEMKVREAHDLAHLVKDRIRAKIPRVYDVLVHVEPRR